MQIDRLYLQNFRLIHEATFEFNPGLNFIVGDNGGGKTAVIEGLAVAMGSWLLGILGQDARQIRTEDIRLDPKQQDHVRVDFTGQLPVVVRSEGNDFSERLAWERGLSVRLRFADY